MARYGAFRESDAKRIARATRIVEGIPGTFVRIPERIPRIAGASCSCPEVHEISTTGSPSSGSFDLTYDIGGSDTVTIAWDDTASEVQTAYETHSGISSGDVSVTGGPLPLVAVYVRFTGDLAGESINLPSISDSLTGGDPRLSKASSHNWGA